MQTPTRLLVVSGTRPEAIKMAPLVLALRERPEFATSFCLSGQHRDMALPVLDFFGLVPDHVLDLGQPGQQLCELTARMLPALDRVLAESNPEFVLVHGDTSTTFAAALAAFYRQIPVAHVEAGLRTGNLAAPWPEEANRRLTAVLARWHLSCTASSTRASVTRAGWKAACSP